MPMILTLAIVLVQLALALSADRPWMDSNLSPSERTELLLAQMTTEEKITMLHGDSSNPNYVGFVKGNDRLGIPELRLNDGPQGYRDDARPGSTTAFPSAMTVGATFDRDLMYKFGAAMGQEFFNKGANIQLGPGVNVARVPLNGRNFEYISGEDPYLGYAMVQPLVKGIQSQNVIANAKHWVENNQEVDRSTVDATVDERTRYEIYYPPFVGAVEAEVGSFMCSYNKINTGNGGKWACENEVTLNEDLKGNIGYKNWVMSDWGGTHSTSINQGLDQEMPGSTFMGDSLQKMVDSGEVKMETIDSSVRRILNPMLSVGLFDLPNNNVVTNKVSTPENIQLARDLSAASHVLLKNDANVLPLPLTAPQKGKKFKIALIGQHVRAPIIGGGGSGSVFPAYISTPYDGILKALGINEIFQTTYTCTNDRTEDTGFGQWGCESWPAKSIEECQDACGNYPTCNHYSWTGSWCGLFPTNNNIIYQKGATSGRCIKTQPPAIFQCNQDNVCVAVIDGEDLDASTSLAKEADVAIVAVATFATESHDRENLQFTQSARAQTCPLAAPNQDNLVFNVAATGVPTVVAAVSPGAVLTSWRESVNAIVLGYMPGQEYGNALADVLFGKVNPSARVSATLPNVDNEIGFTPSMYPGIQKEEIYAEQLLVGYRWYHSKNVTPAYPFGHGLSYTTFKYSDVVIIKAQTDDDVLYTISLSVANTGSRLGADVPQLYLSYPASANEPPRQLKGFEKTSLLSPGASQKVSFVIKERDVSIWNVSTHCWSIVTGTFDVYVGASSADIRFTGSFTY